MEQEMNRFDWVGMEMLSQEEMIMLSCSYTLQEKGRHQGPPYKLFQIPGGAYLVETPRVPGGKHINLILTE